MNLDLNLGPIPEPEDALSGGSVSLEDFIGEVNGRRERLRRRDFQSRYLDSLRERLMPQEIQSLERTDSLNQLRERARQAEIQSLEFTNSLNQLRERARQQGIRSLEQTDILDQLRERVRQQGIQSRERTDSLDQLRERVRQQGIQFQSLEGIDSLDQVRERVRQQGIQSLEQTDTLDQVRERVRQRGIQSLEQSDTLDQVRERVRQQGIQSLERTDSLDQVRERARPQEIQSLERPQEITDRFRERIRQEGTERHWRSLRLPPVTNIMTVRELRQLRDRFASETTRNIASQVMVNPVVDPSSSFLSGEASIAPAERDAQLLKATDSKKEVKLDKEELAGKKDGDKGNDDDDKGSFFDCNICLDLAKDPVVTCCGHLFCWPCVYQWLIHSVANECPVCKGQLSMKSVTPIYGRGNSPCGPEQDPPGPKIPDRPHAQRVESVRQSILRNSVSISMDELVRRLSERTGLVWRDQLASGADGSVAREPLSERILSYFMGRNREEQPLPLDDRGSVSSIAAVIQTESQTIDTVLEIDSNVSLSTSTSRRRNTGNEAARASDVDSGNSRAHQRRRLN